MKERWYDCCQPDKWKEISERAKNSIFSCGVPKILPENVYKFQCTKRSHTSVAYMADGQPSTFGTGRHPGSETSVGLPGEQELYVRRSHIRSQPHYDELQTLREVTEQRRHCENGRSICAVAECRSRHDMMNVQSKPIIWTPYAVAQHTTVARLLKHSFLIFPFE